MTRDARPVEESREAMDELKALVTELNSHTQRLRTEIAALSFMTQVAASDAHATPEIMTKLGGEDGVRTAVVMLYERVMNDPQLSPYFQGVDMMRIRRRQIDMFLALFGSKDYNGKNLRTVHEALGVTHEDFVLLISHIGAVLTYLGVSTGEIAVIVDRLKPFEKEIVV